VWLVDPLALADLGPLAPVFTDPAVLLVLHAGDNDLVHLKRRYAFRFVRLFDTSIAARFLGAKALGLDVLLRDHLAVELPPSRQKDDWSKRPLSEPQERYAAADVLHLIALKNRLLEELRRIGRLAWVEEECAALAAEEVEARVVDPRAWAGLKGARLLPARSLAALRELHAAREQLALAADRPPFKVLSDDTLVRIAQALPGDAAALAEVPGCTPRVVGRWGPAVLAAVGRALALADDALPTLAPPPRGPSMPAAVRRRIERLREWRAAAVPRFGLEPGVLLPNRLIRGIAEAGPRDLAALGAVPGVRQWRVRTFGPELVATVAAA
jgi:ribonuclease D